MDWEVAANKGLLHVGCVLTGVSLRTPTQTFETAAAAIHGINGPVLIKRLNQREARGTTACGQGVAIPRVDSWGIRRPRAVYIRSNTPIGFLPADDNVPVHDVLVLIAPRPATQRYQGMLAHYRALMADPQFLGRLRESDSSPAIWRLFREHEWQSDSHAFGLAPSPRETQLTAVLREAMPGKG